MFQDRVIARDHHSFLRLLRTYMPMRAKSGGSSSLRVSHRCSCVGCPPPHKIFLCSSSPLPVPLEQTIAGISISIHFRTVVANFNNLQTHPVCNLFSTNEINPSENIFNNNVMQNGIRKIVKSWRFNQFLLKSGRLQPHYIDAGDIIYSHTTWHRRIAVIVHKDPSTSRQIWSEAGFFDQAEGI